MADKRKMTVEEMLAAARAEKSGGTPPKSAPNSPKSDETPAEVAQTSPQSEPPSAPAPAAPSVGSVSAKPAKGLSVAEMLAAARAEKSAPKPAAPKPAAPAAAKPPAGGAATAVAAKPAAAKAEPAGPVVKDTASILAAARAKTKPGPVSKSAVAAPAKPAKTKLEVPPMPAKPAYAVPAAAPAPVGTAPTRRGFLGGLSAALAVLFQSSLALGFTSMAVTGVLWVLGFARYMFPNVLIEPPTKFKVGFPDDLAPGQVQTKYIPQFGVWIVRYEYEGQPMIYALKSVCTHLGCTPNWLEGEQKFKCPCHGSGFYKDGINFEGPAPRPLERYAISRADDGQLEVDKSRTFQEELGQWKDTASFVTV
jgi:cytochrome b6-f complex iron-sulfur subunit